MWHSPGPHYTVYMRLPRSCRSVAHHSSPYLRPCCTPRRARAGATLDPIHVKECRACGDMADRPSSESSASPTFSSSESQTPSPSSKKAKIYHDRDWKAVDSQHSFQENWRKEYFVIPHPANSSHCLCLICRSVFTQLKTHTIKQHFESRHKQYVQLEPHSKSSKYDRPLGTHELSERRQS